VRMAKKKMWVAHERAKRELGFNPAPADQALERAVAWFSGPGSRLAHVPAA
jgi:dihydroflavonol-4-reductase